MYLQVITKITTKIIYMIILHLKLSLIITLSRLTLHCHIHPLQAANCCRNSQLAVDEDDFMWVKK